MEKIYWLFGRGNESHCLIQTEAYNVYEIKTPYPVQTTGRMNEVLAVDFAGGPMLVVGDSFENYTIKSIDFIEKKLYVTLK